MLVRLPSRAVLHLLCLALALASPATPPPHGRKISGTLARRVGADVVDYQITPDGGRAVYLVDRDHDEVFELESRAIEPPGNPVRLNGVLPNGGDVRAGFQIDPSGARVVYLADSVVDERVELQSAPIDGSLAPVTLSLTPISGGDVVSFRIDARGRRVVYLADSARDETFELFSAPIDGAGPTVRLNDAFGTVADVTDFALAPDGSRVAFLADPLDQVFELFVVPIDRSSAPLRVHAALPAGGDVERDFAFVSGGGGIAFRADLLVSDELGLFVAPADASAAPRRLDGPLVAGGDVASFALAPDGTRAVYLADQETDGLLDLYGVPLDASQAPVRLGPPLAPDRGVAPDFAIAPDSTRVVFRADADVAGVPQLFAAPLDGATPVERLDDDALVGGPVASFRIAAGGQRVAFLAPAPSGAQQLFAAPSNGSGPVAELGGPLVAGGDVSEFELAGDTAVFRGDRDVDEVLELFRVALDGASPAVKLHRDFHRGENVLPDFRLDPPGRAVLYRADAVTDEAFELFRVALDGSSGPARISEELQSTGTIVGRVSTFRTAGERVVFLGDQSIAGVREVLSVPANGSERPRRISAEPVLGADVQFDYLVSPDEARVLYRVDQEIDGQFELYSAPVDGHAPAVRLNGALPLGGDVTTFAVSPDSTRVVYVADEDLDEQFEIYVVPIEGGGAPLRLDPPQHRFTDARGAALFSADSAFVYYASDRAKRDKEELFRVALDGTSPPVQISRITAPGGDIVRSQLSLDGQRIVYIADGDVNDDAELYVAPADGSAPPVKLNTPIVLHGDVWDYELSADGTRVLYHADQDVDDRIDFYSVPLDGSAAPVRFFPVRAKVSSYSTTKNGRAVFLASFGTRHELYSAPVDASAPPIKLNGPLLQRLSVDSYGITPDGNTVLYVAAQVRGPDVWVVPIDGSAAPRRITAAVPGHVGQIGFSLTLDPRGERVVFETSPAFTFYRDLWIAPLDGSAPARRVNPPTAIGQFIESWAFTERGDGLVYLGDLERNAAELFTTFFEPRGYAAGPPAR